MKHGLTIPGAPIAAKTAIKPVGFTKSGRAVWPILGGSPVMAQAQPEAPPAEGRRVPFVRASYQYREKIRSDSVTLSTAQQTLTPVSITPGGFMRGIWIEVGPPTVNGALGTAVLGSPTDFPFNLIANIVLEDVNGQSIVGPISGYELFLANKYGGYLPQDDPELNPGFGGTFATPYFIIWVPVEVRSDGLGSLANTDARAQYRLIVTIDTQTNITSTGTITTQPVFPVTYWIDYWAQVESHSMTGEPQEQVPPGLGTTQFWYHEVPVVSAGAQTIKHNRVGNAIRTIVYVLRTGAAATGAQPPNPRAALTSYTDPIKLRMDNRYLFSESPNLRRRGLMGRYYFLTGTEGDPAVIGQPVKGILEHGTLVVPFNQDVAYDPSPGDLGDWLETNEATFLQLETTLSGTVATLTILTNDVAPRAA
jgi:hypothetical protein